MTITASEIIAMDDRTIGIHASGGFGPAKRQEFIAAVRRAALAETKANAADEIRRSPFLGTSTPSFA